MLVGTAAVSVRIRGVTGDLVPDLEPRRKKPTAILTNNNVHADEAARDRPPSAAMRPDFPQFLDPERTAVLTHPDLGPIGQDFPRILWR